MNLPLSCSLLAAALVVAPQPSDAKQPTEAKRIGILVFDGVLTSDVVAPAEALGMALKVGGRTDRSVELVSAHDRPAVETHEGIRLLVDRHIGEAPDYDVLIIPGSYEVEALIAQPELAAYLRRAAPAAEMVASNCAGAFLAASTGVFDGRRVTTYATGAAVLRGAFPRVEAVEGRVVVDGSLITSNGGVVSYESAVVLVARLFDIAVARKVFDALQMQQTMPWAQIEAHLPARPAPAPTGDAKAP